MARLHYQKPPSEKDQKSFAKYLAEDEELILATGLGKAYLRSRFIISLAWPGGIFLGLGAALAWGLKFEINYGLILGLILASFVAVFKTYITYHSNRYLLTTRRLIIKRGLIAVKLASALYDKVTHIEVDQTLFDRVFMHHGTIIVNTAGMNKGEITLKFVDYPIELKNLMERLINRESEQHGFRTGPVVTVEGEVVS
ncbi:MAG: PH domain-containing protein [Candidatus Daviesbacteria bacterium]